MNHSAITKLTGKDIKAAKKVIAVPGIEKIQTSDAKLYAIKFFCHRSDAVIPIRITSKFGNFKEIYSVDFYDGAHRPVLGFMIKPDMPVGELQRFISDTVSTIKVKKKKGLKESTYVSEYFMTEVGFPGVADLIGGMDDGNPGKALSGYLKFVAAVYGIMVVISLVMKYRYYFVRIKNWATEKYISGPQEQKLNAQLFQGQTGDDPPFAMYDSMVAFIDQIIKGNNPAFIICGPPGMSKTYMIRRTMYFQGLKPGKHYNIVKGSALGIEDTYSLLYYNRKKILILDDFDTPLRDENMVNLMKSITDSYGKRFISLPRKKTLGSHEAGAETQSAVPDKFEFKGQLIIITNLRKRDIDRALLSRAPAFEVNYNTKEVMTAADKLLKFISPEVDMATKKEVYKYVSQLVRQNKRASVDFRKFKLAIDARVGNPYSWKDMVRIMVIQ